MTSFDFHSYALLIYAIIGFFIARSIVLWYFKIGEISNNLKVTSESLVKISESLEKISNNQGFDFDSKVNLLKVSQSLEGMNRFFDSMSKNSTNIENKIK